MAVAAPVATRRTYDVASIDQFKLEAEAEQNRLRAEIEAAIDRIEVAESHAAPRLQAARSELGTLVLAAYEQLTAIEREYRDAICTTRDRAVAEATRLLEAAREQAIAVRARAAKER